MSTNVYLREYLGPEVSKRLSTAPGIEEQKIDNAINAFGDGGGHLNVLASLDNTVFGCGKDGLLLISEQVIYRDKVLSMSVHSSSMTTSSDFSVPTVRGSRR